MKAKDNWRLDAPGNADKFLRDIGARKSSGGTIAMHIFRGSRVLEGLLEMDPITLRAIECIAHWLKTTSRLKPGHAPLCLTCDAEFSRHNPLPITFLNQNESSPGSAGVAVEV